MWNEKNSASPNRECHDLLLLHHNTIVIEHVKPQPSKVAKLHVKLLSFTNSGTLATPPSWDNIYRKKHALNSHQPLCKFIKLMPLRNGNFLLCIINPQESYGWYNFLREKSILISLHVGILTDPKSLCRVAHDCRIKTKCTNSQDDYYCETWEIWDNLPGVILNFLWMIFDNSIQFWSDICRWAFTF